ncbi:aryl-alcohol dehydrogenase-like predicted oxidoreductase [Pontibacter aydingkolensis]|uniref:Aldo/keto reductase n=1 Tax=Pontibacter aydingkolensis TaxID=1911536 RepID=A0ABS7CVP5_9BACT|nr:aldo/keto reductase [Pontibacter aydingkolensis]MBW7467889.1 aldo/keto reductase [Pontibacter aydingkolensis]
MSKLENVHKLILGTAQFGLDYGISNTRGQITQTEVEAILLRAAEAGITTLDSAAAYGESETTIGKALQGKSGFSIITKYPPNTPGKSIKQAFEESLQRLVQEKVYGYLLHSFSTYETNPAVLDELLQLKAEGKVAKIGVSLYHPSEAETLLKAAAPIDILQFPYSVFDRRFESILPELRAKGIETHVRSIYLQGLYFMKPEAIPAHLQKAAPKVKALQQLATKDKLPLGSMLMGFVLQNEYITNVVVGVENLQTLKENITFASTQLPKELILALQDFEEQDENIILPYNWAKA